jgi:heme A synthase
MRRVVGGLVLAAWLVGQPASAGTRTQADEARLALGAGLVNVFYFPVKVLVATGGLVAGALVGFAAGGSERAAYAFWVPAASGTYLIRPSHLDGSEPWEFFGSDYEDRPSSRPGASGRAIYEALYSGVTADSEVDDAEGHGPGGE